MKNPVAELMREHIEALAEEFGVTILPYGGDFLTDDCVELPCGAAGELLLLDESLPIIWISEEPVNAAAYLVALHELGHHAIDATDDEFHREAWAWTWAITRSIIELDETHQAFINSRLETYAD